MSTSSKGMLLSNQNPNIEWAGIFVDELARGGLTAVCIAPGSRSTPLALAFHAHPDINIFVHLDERSASFFALGMALAEKKPVALVCTSGTAAANFYPAVIEAQLSLVPLIILTADRPHELRQSGANQTIDQVKMFGDHVLWSVDVALPQVAAPPAVLRYLRTLAARTLAAAGGLVKGPVHLNFPFRKPLEPSKRAYFQNMVKTLNSGQPYTRFERGSLQASESQIAFASDLIDSYRHGLIICGPDCPGGDFPKAVARLSRAAGYPILADSLSGVRYGPHIQDTPIISGYETFLQEERSSWTVPDVIIRFGKVPTSKWLNEYLRQNQLAFHFHVRESGVWADGDHITNHFLQASPAHFCRRLASPLTQSVDQEWVNQWVTAESICVTSVAQFMNETHFDAAVPFSMFDQLPSGTSLFAGNSLAIRHIDQFCPPQQKAIHLFSNRGASGIDGNISTGLGIAATTSEPVVLLVGDITFYHDSNGLLAIKKFGINNVTIVLLNNNGGGIFRQLPVSKFEPVFQELFLTQHDLDFAPLAKLYGLDYIVAENMASFTKTFTAALTNKAPTIIEVQTNSRTDDMARRAIVSIVNSKVTGEYQ